MKAPEEYKKLLRARNPALTGEEIDKLYTASCEELSAPLLTTEDLQAVYEQLKDKYDLVFTHTGALEGGFTADFPIMVGSAHGQILYLSEEGVDFVLTVENIQRTMDTHWHPMDVEDAIFDVEEFMQGRADYDLQPIHKVVCHEMKLHSAPFGMIKSGKKTIELRLYDEKRQKIKPGDQILFTNTATGETLEKTVVKLHIFPDFAALYAALPLLQCGYTEEDIATAHPDDMNMYYSAEDQAKYGVVGIDIF